MISLLISSFKPLKLIEGSAWMRWVNDAQDRLKAAELSWYLVLRQQGPQPGAGLPDLFLEIDAGADTQPDG